MNVYRPLALPSKSKLVQVKEREYWNSRRSKNEADFYTMGYSGRKTIEFIIALKTVGICSVVDIRFSPISLHRSDFNKTNLQKLLIAYDIDYSHRPELGIPRDIRGLALDSHDRDVLWHWYDNYVVSSYVNGNLDNFFNSVVHPIALLCVEISPLECHRHRLALALESRGLRSYDL